VPDKANHATRRDRLVHLRAEALACVRCPLAASGNQVVLGEGRADARLMIVGEAPGAEEDAAGRPFQGRAGKILDALLRQIGLVRADVYIANVVMHRPPGNRRPRPDEIRACAPYLDAQLDIVRPTFTLALGATATRRLLGRRTTIKAARGQAHQTEAGTVLATYHPSPVSLNRDPARRSAVEADLALVRDLLAQS
jgi:uracil-DNA glycosylase family 4